eukprot:jgi/Picsp_1/2264/NSC_05728-R1_trafficking protein particle complex subunit 2-like
MSLPAVRGVAVLDASNGPLYLQVVNSPDAEEDTLEIECVMYASLDILEEKLKDDGESDGAGPYLGALYSLGGHTIYGYVTSTNKRLLLALQQGAERIQDALVTEIFSKILKAYVNEISNPFYDPAIESRELSKAIQQNSS